MTRPLSLRTRLAVVAAGVTAAWVVILTVAFNLLLASQLRGEANDLLRTRAEAVASTLTVAADGTVTQNEPVGGDVLDADTWIFSGQRLVDRARGSTDALLDAAGRLAGTGERLVEVDEPHALLYAEPLLRDGHQVATVVTAVALNPYQRLERLALAGSAALAGLLLLGVYLVARFVVARALRPVAELTAQAETWSTEDVARRFGSAKRPRELAELASSLDGLLDRLSAVLRHEQQLSAEISHELRTPLSRIAAEVELLGSRGRSAAERRSAYSQIASSAEQMGRILDSLLAVARQQATTLPGRCSVAEVLDAMAAQWPVGGPALRYTSPGRSLNAGVDGAILERMVAPLLDNAHRHATRTVTLQAGKAQDGTIQVTVSDDGQGVADDLQEAVFDPGFRADPGDGHDGAGLGLALSRRLARAVGGDVRVQPSDVGAAFVVCLPS